MDPFFRAVFREAYFVQQNMGDLVIGQVLDVSFALVNIHVADVVTIVWLHR